jgi:hypothetical protein
LQSSIESKSADVAAFWMRCVATAGICCLGGARPRVTSCILHINLSAEILHDPLELAQPTHQLNLPLCRVALGHRVRISRTRSSRCSAGCRKHAGYMRSLAVGTRHVLVAAHFSFSASHAAPWVEPCTGRSARRVHRDAGSGMGVDDVVVALVARRLAARRLVVSFHRLHRRRVRRRLERGGSHGRGLFSRLNSCDRTRARQMGRTGCYATCSSACCAWLAMRNLCGCCGF